MSDGPQEKGAAMSLMSPRPVSRVTFAIARFDTFHLN
jgi:hypothetical protein